MEKINYNLELIRKNSLELKENDFLSVDDYLTIRKDSHNTYSLLERIHGTVNHNVIYNEMTIEETLDALLECE